MIDNYELLHFIPFLDMIVYDYLETMLIEGELFVTGGCVLFFCSLPFACSCVDRKSSDLGLGGMRREYLQTDCAINAVRQTLTFFCLSSLCLLFIYLLLFIFLFFFIGWWVWVGVGVCMYWDVWLPMLRRLTFAFRVPLSTRSCYKGSW